MNLVWQMSLSGRDSHTQEYEPCLAISSHLVRGFQEVSHFAWPSRTHLPRGKVLREINLDILNLFGKPFVAFKELIFGQQLDRHIHLGD
jgi:hypothetical protein